MRDVLERIRLSEIEYRGVKMAGHRRAVSDSGHDLPGLVSAILVMSPPSELSANGGELPSGFL